MLIFCLFAPLAPTDRYPYSTFEMTLDGRSYDLPLPVFVGEALDAAITSPDLKFLRLDRYGDVSRIDKVRDDHALLDRESGGTPAYAEVESSFKLVGDTGEPDRGDETRRVIVSRQATERLLALLHEGKFFDERVEEHLLRRESFFHESGGFELLSALYYFDDAEHREVRRSAAENRPKALSERRDRKLRFRDVMQPTSQ